jgi:AcrR family transcriptional regulator
VTGDAAPRRRRRRPDEARAEILAAARALLAERPAHEVTVGAIMAATSLSRKSFYVYFTDRFDLLTQLVDPLRAERDAIVEELLAQDDAAAGGREALLALARLYADHGVVLRALAEASGQDDEARRAWRVRGVDPEPTARALIGMNLQYFFDTLVGVEDPDVEGAAETLLVVWSRALYASA